MIGILYTFNFEIKIIVLNYKTIVGVYKYAESKFKNMILYSLESFPNINTKKIEGQYIFYPTKNTNKEDIIVEGLIKIFFSKNNISNLYK